MATGIFGLKESQIDLMKRAFWPMLEKGITYSIPLTLISFAIGIIIAVLVALVVINKVPVIRQIAGIYVWIFREHRFWYSYLLFTGEFVIRWELTSGLPVLLHFH